MSADPPLDRRRVAIAGHTGDTGTARSGLSSPDPGVRATALGALERLGELEPRELRAACADQSPAVRRRAAEVAARHPEVDLLALLDDAEPMVIEAAAWAAGEHENDRGALVARLVDLAASHDDALVREASVAALGAIGSDAGRAAILSALTDKPAVRRRAVLALAPFAGNDIDAAIERSRADRDWQVRQAAEDLQRAMR